MSVTLHLHDEFKRQFRRLKKKYQSLTVLVSDDADVTLLTIYDKSEIENVSDEYIKWLISETGK